LFNLPLLSKIGTFQLPVQVLQAAAVPISPGCTAVAQALAHALSVDNATLPSLISFQVAPSNTTTSQSVELAGQFTSQLPLPLSPLGIPKLRIASVLVHTLVTVALLQAGNVVVVQIAIVAHGQVAPVSHSGIPKSNTAALEVQELTTVTELQAGNVDTLPTAIVAAVPGFPCSHFRFEY